jgi:hypothetical protein
VCREKPLSRPGTGAARRRSPAIGSIIVLPPRRYASPGRAMQRVWYYFPWPGVCVCVSVQVIVRSKLVAVCGSRATNPLPAVSTEHPPMTEGVQEDGDPVKGMEHA